MRHPIDTFGCLRSLSRSLSRVSPSSLLLLLGAVFLLGSGRAWGDEQYRAVRLSDIHGSVQVMLGTGTQYQKAYANMPLLEGTRVQTGGNGRAEVQFEDGSIARLTPNSSLLLSQLKTDSNSSRITEIELLSGLGYFELQPKSNTDDNTVYYQQSRITSGSLAIFRINADNPPGEIDVLSGNLHVEGSTGFAVDVHENEQLRFDSTDGSRYSLAQGVSDESWDRWNSDRDRALNEAAAEQTAATASFSDSQNPAWNDLDAYGNWYNVSGYGPVWSPYGAGPGWDPYGYGYWSWYPGYGYMWVSGYNWGYMPYRCGAWNYFNDFGWGWIPGGGCGSGFFMNTNINIWNSPSGYRPPPRPVQDHGFTAVTTNPHPVVPVDRGSSARYKPQPIYGVGGVARPVLIGGKPVQPLPPIRSGNGNAFAGSDPDNGSGGSVITGRVGIRPGDRTVAPVNPGTPASQTWNTIRPQPSRGVIQNGSSTEVPGVTAPVQRPVIVQPRPVVTPPRMNPVQPSGPRTITPAPSPTPRMAPSAPPAPRSMPSPAPAPRSSPSPAPSSSPRPH